MTPTLIQIPTLNDAPRDFCVLNKRAEENERLTICKQLKWFWFYPQIYADFLPQDGRDERLLVRGQADACPSRCFARRMTGLCSFTLSPYTSSVTLRRYTSSVTLRRLHFVASAVD